MVRPGGVLVITVKDKTWADGFAARVEELREEGWSRTVRRHPLQDGRC